MHPSWKKHTFWVHQSLPGAESDVLVPQSQTEKGKKQILGRDIVVVVAAFLRRAFPEFHWCMANRRVLSNLVPVSCLDWFCRFHTRRLKCAFTLHETMHAPTRDEVRNVHLLLTESDCAEMTWCKLTGTTVVVFSDKIIFSCHLLYCICKHSISI